MKRFYILLMACVAIVACKHNEVKFTYTPTEPRAGQPVRFNNLSSSGEEWEWNFGDGITSTIKSPSHTYKQPGTYVVILKVDGKNSWTDTQKITVYDTVPTFVANDSVFYIYQDYTFVANMYNPYKYDVEYTWLFPLNTPYIQVVSPENSRAEQLTAYFTQPMEKAPIGLDMILNGDTIHIERTFIVLDRPTHSVLFRTAEADYRQRIFGAREEQYKVDETATEILNAAQDTAQTYNGQIITLSELKTRFPGIEGFSITDRKIYYRANGLWVAALDGSRQVQIDKAPCTAMTVDKKDNRLYWANGEGIWYMPLIGSDNNQFVNTPVMLNEQTSVTKMTMDINAK